MLETLYRDLYRIRRVEEEIARVYPTDKVMSPVHLSIGQEAAAVGVCAGLKPSDIVFGSYRCHALYLAKGGDLRRMIAELYGKAAGCAKGKAGSMHLIDAAAGVMGASAVVATTIPLAVGYAYAEKLRRKPTVVVSFFGDGAVEEGVFHESLNFAALKQLPVLFVCENNFYAIHSRQSTRQSVGKICDLAAAHGIETRQFPDMNVLEIREQTLQAAEALRTGQGPKFFEICCYRWLEHVGPNRDFHAGYRHEAEAQPWIANDQLAILGDQLDARRRRAVESAVDAEIAEAFQFAEEAPFPDDAELYADMCEDA